MNNKSIKKPGNGFERHVVLVSPEIHWNTGNIGRTCLATGAHLHLIKPLGFSLKSREVKRAGLDYWNKVKLSVWDNFKDFKKKMEPGKNEVIILSKKGKKSFWSMPICQKMFLIFGSETHGLSKEILSMYKDYSFHIPITCDTRSLNLSTAAGIILYESLRGVDFNHFWV
ncbi:MAG: tRNA (cytidine(34)-2'-O)-methyltransferase [Deltaproteobacteria bacterium]|nr:tRNA (cytidine(34)-2'-O)-methyltransferase [Deltaproteobacteria bacterium]